MRDVIDDILISMENGCRMKDRSMAVVEYMKEMKHGTTLRLLLLTSYHGAF